MKTKEEILSEITGLTVSDDMVRMQTQISYILQAMDVYAEQQVKNCSIPDVGQRFYHFDSWNRNGEMYETEVIEAFNQSGAIVLFQSRFPDRGFDPPY